MNERGIPSSTPETGDGPITALFLSSLSRRLDLLLQGSVEQLASSGLLMCLSTVGAADWYQLCLVLLGCPATNICHLIQSLQQPCGVQVLMLAPSCRWEN